MKLKKKSCNKSFIRDGFDFRCGERHSYDGYDYCDSCLKTQEIEEK